MKQEKKRLNKRRAIIVFLLLLLFGVGWFFITYGMLPEENTDIPTLTRMPYPVGQIPDTALIIDRGGFFSYNTVY